LASVPREAMAFWRVRDRLIRTTLHKTLRHGWFRFALTALLSLTLWAGLFLLCAEGFQFLEKAIGVRDTYDQTVRGLFGIFFGSLTVMLVFSSGIILYSSLFFCEEAKFLLTLPARTQRIFLYKFEEAVLLSGWGFLLLGSPLLVASGVVGQAPWYYYLVLFPFMAAFVYIPAACGAALCLGIVYMLPRRRLMIAVAAAVVAIGVSIWLGTSLLKTPESQILTPTWFYEILGRLQYTEQRMLPSWWLSNGLLEAARGEPLESFLFLMLLVSNALLAREVVGAMAGRLYRPAFSALQGAHSGHRRTRWGALDRGLLRAGGFVALELRLLLLKDLRLFRRDPVQWSQFLILFGLMCMYFLNIRRFHYDVQYAGSIHTISFLNLSVIGLLLAIFNTRFIFPTISVEGRRFWILGLLPLRRETILWGKFLFGAFAFMVPSCALVLLSDLMLRVDAAILLSHQFTTVLLSVGLSGIAVGLGTKLPDFREPSPSRIAAGFGGTLNLVVSALFIAVIVAATAVPCHFCVVLNNTDPRLPTVGTMAKYFYVWLMSGTAVSLVLTVIATVLPLRMGFTAIRDMEF